MLIHATDTAWYCGTISKISFPKIRNMRSAFQKAKVCSGEDNFFNMTIYLHLTLENNKIVPDVNSNYLEDNATNTLIGQKHFWNLFLTSWAVGLFRRGHFFNTSLYMVSAKENTDSQRSKKKRGIGQNRFW